MNHILKSDINPNIPEEIAANRKGRARILKQKRHEEKELEIEVSTALDKYLGIDPEKEEMEAREFGGQERGYSPFDDTQEFHESFV